MPDPPLHICFLCNEYPPQRHGGIGSFTQTLARELVRHGHSVSTVGLYPIAATSREDDEGVAVIRVPEGRVPGFRIASNYIRIQRVLRDLQRERRIDVLEGAERSFCLVSPGLAVPKLIRMHGGHVFFRVALGQAPNRQKVMEERRSFRVATHLCAVSRFVGETTRDYLGLGPRPIPVISNPVDLRIFYPRDPTLEEDGLIVYVGTIIEKKGIRQLLEAMPLVLKQHPSARLVAYGNDTADPATGESFTEILRSRIPPEAQGRIEFAGPVRRDLLPGLIAKASICVYPSHMEALPIAWVEGLAMGKAVVASETGPGPEVLEHGVSGLLCDPHDPAAIAAALLRFLRDRDLRIRFGRAARDRAEKLFALERLVDENVAFYRRCCAGY